MPHEIVEMLYRINRGANCQVAIDPSTFIKLFKRQINCQLGLGNSSSFEGVGVQIISIPGYPNTFIILSHVILFWILGSRTPKKESKVSILHGQQIEQPKKKSPKSFQLVLKNLKPSNVNLEARMHLSMANICTSWFGLVPT